MEQTIPASPFSQTQHLWELDWKRISSRELATQSLIYETNSRKERKALEALAAVGLMKGTQLRTLFKLDKPQIRRMEHSRLIMKQVIRKNRQEIVLYTLDPASKEKAAPHFVPNYWVEYEVKDVLNRILFFALYDVLKPQKAKIAPAPKPFTGALELGGNKLYVYYTRGETKDLQMLLKWQAMTERVIIITERLEHLSPLLLFIQGKKLKVRTITDNQLFSEQPQFYTYHMHQNDGHGWVLESRQH